MSDTNFCAASARSRFLQHNERCGGHNSASRYAKWARRVSYVLVWCANKRSSEDNGQTGVLTVKADALEVVVRHLIRDLIPYVSCAVASADQREWHDSHLSNWTIEKCGTNSPGGHSRLASRETQLVSYPSSPLLLPAEMTAPSDLHSVHSHSR